MTDLPADPELDRLIQEDVMGWTSDSLWKDGRKLFSDFRPSTTIADAWEVLVHLRNHGIPLSIGPDSADPTSDWSVYRLGQIGEKLLASAPTAPLAICRAALAVVGSKP